MIPDDQQKPLTAAAHSPAHEGMLEYRPGAADYKPILKRQVVAGAFTACAIGMGAVFIAFLASLGPKWTFVPFLVIVSFAVVGINAWAFLSYRKSEWRGFGI